MSDPKFDDFKHRLEAAQNAHKPKASKRSASAAGMGAGMRIAIDFVVAVAVGFGIGLGLDRLLGTKPWFMLVMFAFGIAAAFRNAIRTAEKLDAEAKARREAETANQAAPDVNHLPASATVSEQGQKTHGLGWSDDEDDENEPWIHESKN